MGVLRNVSRGRIKLKIKVLFDKRCGPLNIQCICIVYTENEVFINSFFFMKNSFLQLFVIIDMFLFTFKNLICTCTSLNTLRVKQRTIQPILSKVTI